MMALPMYCKAYGVTIDKKNITEKQKEIWAKRAAMVLNRSKIYFEELGNNAYALYSVLTDYAFSEYRIMWILVFFDLPTDTKKERKAKQRLSSERICWKMDL